MSEIENVATKSTDGWRGTSEVATQLGDFIMFSIRFLQNLGNLQHNGDYVQYENSQYGYTTETDNPTKGIGVISFRFVNESDVVIDNISVDLKNYNLLIENKQHKKMLSLIERRDDLYN